MTQSLPAGGYLPPVGFHFSVRFVGLGNDNDIRFQSVGGLTVESDTETFKEGGENRFEHRLPTRTKYPNLSLKRGMLLDSEVIRWCNDAFDNRVLRPVQVDVSLLNEHHEPLRTWQVKRAWPRKWAVSDFSATDNALVIETLELSYAYFTIT